MDKDHFYTRLNTLLDEIHHRENSLIILGDFNARVHTREGPAAVAVFGRFHFHRGLGAGTEAEELENASLPVIDNRARMIELASNKQSL